MKSGVCEGDLVGSLVGQDEWEWVGLWDDARMASTNGSHGQPSSLEVLEILGGSDIRCIDFVPRAKK
eukprot:9174466-Ditylum_brightwellii.AAC.1